jgi:PAS domain S-box-containing protein
MTSSLLNKSWIDFWKIAEDKQAAQASVASAAAGRVATFVGFFRTLHGIEKWWDVTIAPILDANGKPARLLAVSRDVTKRKRAEVALHETSERWRFLMSASELGAWEFNPVDHSTWHSQRHDQIFGYPQSLPAWTYKLFLRHVLEEDRADVDRCYKHAMAHQQDWNFECRIRRADGLVRWIRAHGKRIEDVGGRPARIFGLIADITERKLHQEIVRESEQRFRALFDKGPIAIYCCDVAGNILEINQAAIALLGQPAPGQGDAQFRGALKFYLADGITVLPYASTWISKVLRGEMAEAHNVELIIERADATRITVVTTLVPLKNEHGAITGAINCFYDITERSRLERKTQELAQTLADMDRRKDEFLAMLGHELRNPLAALTSAAQLLQMHQREDPVQRQGRTIIERQVGQLTHLVDDLLEVSRITHGNVQLRLEPVSLCGVVERAIETTQPLMAQRRHRLTVALPAQPVWLHADAGRLEQVVVNLLTNAAKYTDEGGSIALGIELEGEGTSQPHEAVLRIRDNGIGIAPELLPHIFELFTQAERALDRSQGGLGIGLSLVQRLVELHGGSVQAQSIVGQGSEFVVRLPLMRKALVPLMPLVCLAPLAPLLPAPDTVKPLASGCRVLVVDDNVDAAETLAAMLEMTGYKVQLARRPQCAASSAGQRANGGTARHWFAGNQWV